MNANYELIILRAYLKTLALPKNIFETSRQNFSDSFDKIIKLSELCCDFINKHNFCDLPMKIDKLYIVALDINNACNTFGNALTNQKPPKNPDWVLDTSFVEPTEDAYKELRKKIYEFFRVDDEE
jgi:hypothetical protein